MSAPMRPDESGDSVDERPDQAQPNHTAMASPTPARLAPYHVHAHTPKCHTHCAASFFGTATDGEGIERGWEMIMQTKTASGVVETESAMVNEPEASAGSLAIPSPFDYLITPTLTPPFTHASSL
ncbi:hypothetical protein DFH06DRAFT_1350569 [Mycena polygramma]|nr:hypothetical protein DFH06DRAFT_1350569 [Mycena polygramma]